LLEETGLKGRFAGVLYVSEFMAEDRHTVDVTVRVEAPNGEAQLGSDPEVEEGAEPTLRELRWVQSGELEEEIELLPSWIREKLLEDAARGWPAGEVYLRGEGA
jgi:8-oxo-dGTP diphosphatase